MWHLFRDLGRGGQVLVDWVAEQPDRRYDRLVKQAYAHIPQMIGDSFIHIRSDYLTVPSPFDVGSFDDFKKVVNAFEDQVHNLKTNKARSELLRDRVDDNPCFNCSCGTLDEFEFEAPPKDDLMAIMDEDRLKAALAWKSLSLAGKYREVINNFWFGRFDDEVVDQLTRENNFGLVNSGGDGAKEQEGILHDGARNYDVGIIVSGSNGNVKDISIDFLEVDVDAGCAAGFESLSHVTHIHSFTIQSYHSRKWFCPRITHSNP